MCLQTLLVWHQEEEHPACKNWVMRCWCGYLSWKRCRLKLILIDRCCMWSSWCHCHPTTPSSLALFKSRLILLEKRPLNWCTSSGGGSSNSLIKNGWGFWVCVTDSACVIVFLRLLQRLYAIMSQKVTPVGCIHAECITLYMVLRSLYNV